MDDLDIHTLDRFIAILEIAKHRLKSSRFASANTKRKLYTDLGLCNLVNSIIELGNSGTCIQVRLLNLLRKIADENGLLALPSSSYWWKIGKIKPRLKTVNLTLKWLKIKRLLTKQRIYLENNIHI
jgi:hypothetical protein